ncbi:cytochrome c-type biogenesis protein [Niveispirillum cyanobacteriorum]|uniref:Cytochrome c-type biogenesis protein n=1 Tax=Niveispirillum cyanobacteriorum TaxID=1612173 RepID=A0A2K9NFE0_9PROT|nr:cytochrome c-type biogenesis protein [Niveispirillum cyanobacteriorum]AUN31840.1 cytochrome C biogenesis protein CcmH [Niveispirillum cyanobacteriorum]
MRSLRRRAGAFAPLAYGARAPGRQSPAYAVGRFWPSAWIASTLLAATLVLPALAVMPDEKLADPVMEARAREISKELRCLVCQNQSIDDSNADLARDLRVLVRERLVAGDSNEQVLAYVHDRYGDFVLLRPPVTGYTALLWGGPFALLLLAGFGTALYMRQRRRDVETTPAPALTAEEEARLAALLNDDKPGVGR